MLTFIVAAALSIADAGHGAVACGRPLRQVRSEWRVVEGVRGPAACRAKQALWLELRGCYAGFGDWVPDLRTVGDCHVEAQDPKAAEAFYRRVMATARDLPCTHDGWDCGRAAAVELRLLDCGFAWLAADAESAWKGFGNALLGSATPAAFHLPPVVDSEDIDADPDLSCGARAAARSGFRVPAAITRNARSIAQAVADSTVSATERAVSVELDASERAWALGPRGGPERMLRVQACRFQRPHAGAPGPRYYIALNLATPAESGKADCASALSWIGHRLP